MVIILLNGGHKTEKENAGKEVLIPQSTFWDTKNVFLIAFLMKMVNLLGSECSDSSHTKETRFGCVAPWSSLHCTACAAVYLLVCWCTSPWGSSSVISFTYCTKIGDSIIHLCDKPVFQGQHNEKRGLSAHWYVI